MPHTKLASFFPPELILIKKKQCRFFPQLPKASSTLLSFVVTAMVQILQL